MVLNAAQQQLVDRIVSGLEIKSPNAANCLCQNILAYLGGNSSLTTAQAVEPILRPSIQSLGSNRPEAHRPILKGVLLALAEYV